VSSPANKDYLQHRQIALLKEVNRILVAPGSLPDVLDAILATFERLYGKHHICIFLLDEPSQELYAIAARGLLVEKVYARRFRHGLDGIVGRAAASGQPIYVPDAHAEPNYIHIPTDTGEELRSEFAIPLLARGQLVGVLNVESTAPDGFPCEIRELLLSLADSLAVAIGTARGHELARTRAQRLEALAHLTTQLGAGDNLAAVLRTIHACCRELLGVPAMHTWLLEPDSTTLRLQHPHEYGEGEYTLRVGEGPVGRAVSQGVPFVCHDLLAEQPDLVYRAEDEKLGWRSYAVVPLNYEAKCLGALSIFSSEPHRFSPEDMRLLAAFASHAAVALAKTQLIDALHQSQAKLKQEKEFVSSLIEGAHEAICLHDTEGNCLWANRECLRLSGYTLEQFSFPKCVLEADQPRARRAWEQAREGEAQELEVRLHTAAGRSLQMLFSLTPVREAAGCVNKILLIGNDITERKRLQLQLAESERLAALGRLIAGVAHELNNPLQVMLGFSELLLRDSGLGVAQRRFAGHIQQESQRAKKIVNNLLTFARQSPLEKVPTDLNALLQQLLEMRAYSLRMNGVSVETLFRTLPPVVCDAHRLQQAFLNLLLNAEQSLEKVSGPRHLFITTETSQSSQGAVVRVFIRDTGCGIPREDLSRVFDPFFTTKAPREGTGLGLSMAYAIVREHGGTIELSSELGQGTSVTVTLPVGAPAEAATGQFLPNVLPPEPAPDPARRYALVIDDEEHICDFLVECLGEAGLWVDTATTANQALARLRQRAYDLVLCDIKMPGKSGIELYQEITKEQPELAARFVFITGDAISPGTREFLDTSGCCCLLKPFGMQEVLELVAKFA